MLDPEKSLFLADVVVGLTVLAFRFSPVSIKEAAVVKVGVLEELA